MARKLGRSGEKRFSTLCSDLGITCNEPQEDENGWDHIVEFPHIPVTGLPADLQRPLPPVLVQTKSHEAEGLTVRVKLSNALKFARSPNPCFVVLMTLSPDSTIPRWHAVHFWEVLISRTLERARKATHDGIPEEEFNHHWLSFTMTDDDEHTDDLLPWMERTIRSVSPDYAAAKRNLQETVGFGSTRFVGTVQIGPLRSIDELLDHQLGLTPMIPMSKVELNDRRFGIDIPLPLPDAPITFAQMQARPADQCDVRVRGPDGFEFSLVGDLIVAGVPADPTKRFKVRIRTAVLDVVWSSSGTSTFNIHVSTSDRRSPMEIEQIARLLSWSGENPIEIRVSVHDQRVLGAELRLDPVPDQAGYARIAPLASSLVTVSRHLRSATPAISIEEVNESELLEAFHLFVTGTEMQADAQASSGEPLPAVDHGVAYGLTSVGDWIFGALMRWQIVEQRHEHGSWSIKFGFPQLLEGYAFKASDAAGAEALKADYLRHASKRGALPLDNAITALACRLSTSRVEEGRLS